MGGEEARRKKDEEGEERMRKSWIERLGGGGIQRRIERKNRENEV